MSGLHDPREPRVRSAQRSRDGLYLNGNGNGGRPRHVNTRWTEDDYALLSYLAMRAGKTPAEWGEMLLRQHLDAAKLGQQWSRKIPE